MKNTNEIYWMLIHLRELGIQRRVSYFFRHALYERVKCNHSSLISLYLVSSIFWTFSSFSVFEAQLIPHLLYLSIILSFAICKPYHGCKGHFTILYFLWALCVIWSRHLSSWLEVTCLSHILSAPGNYLSDRSLVYNVRKLRRILGISPYAITSLDSTTIFTVTILPRSRDCYFFHILTNFFDQSNLNVRDFPACALPECRIICLNCLCNS